MKKHYLALFVLLSLSVVQSFAQMVGTNCFVQGTFLDIGMNRNGSFGACDANGAIPPSYHRHAFAGAPPTGTALAETYDYGKDGWATGAPVFMGDYTYPGSPFEGWMLQIGASRAQAFQNCPGNFTAAGITLAGNHTAYTSVGGRQIGTWNGTATSPGGNLSIRQETRIDAAASAVVVTTVLTNTGAAPTADVYYMRTCDPDNDQTWPGGGFWTHNVIVHQNEDARHRVMVSSVGATGAASYMALGTKDCRARCGIYDLWPISIGENLAAVWNGTAMAANATYGPVGGFRDGDIGILLVYRLGAIAPGDSTIVSYAYIFNGNLGIDSAFPDPQIVVNGTPKVSWAPPTPNRDTFDACLYPGLTNIPVNILNATDKSWSWSKWTWSPGLGLATTTGVTNTITFAGLPPVITYTITGTDSATGMFSCHNKVFYLTILNCNNAVANNPCEGDAIYFNAPGDSTGATYQWYGPAPSTTVFATTQSATITPATLANSGTYSVIKTVAGVPDTSEVTVTVFADPVVTATSSLAFCAPITGTVNLFCNTDSICNSWSWTGPAGFTSTSQNPILNPFSIANEGVYTVRATSLKGCEGTGTVLVKPGPAPILGPSGLCQFFTITVTDATPGGVWSSSSPAIASITSAGVVTGHLPGTVTVTYTMPNTCFTTKTITVHPKPAPPIVPEVRPCQFKPVGVLSVTVTGAGYSSTWYGLGVTPGSTFPSGVSTIVPKTDTTPGTFYYYVTQTSPFGCVSDSAIYPVRLIAEPNAPLPHDTSYCQFDPLVAPVKAYGDSLRWYTSSTAPAGTGSFTAPVPSVANPGVTTYYVTQNVMGCESPKVPVKVTVLVLPEFTITAERDWVCQHDSLEISYNGPLYIDPAYVWTLPIGSEFVNGTNNGDKDIEVRFDTVWGRHDVILEVSNYGGRCFTRDTFAVRVIPAPDAHPYMKTDLCLGDTITLALNSHSANSHTYTWTVDGLPMATSPAMRILSANSNSGGPYVVTWVDSGIHIIHVTGATAEGCLAEPAYDTVKVHALPDSRYSVTEIPDKFCVDDSVLFKAAVTDYAYNYRWEPENFFSNQNKPEIWGRVQLTQSRISLTVTDPFGCKSTYTKTITPDECCTVTMPNAFTPNNDGKNDTYRPLFAGYRRFHVFRVTNRWGQTVFESGNSEPAWDGTRNGEPQDMGTYFYYLKYDCGGKSHETKGDVTLIR